MITKAFIYRYIIIRLFELFKQSKQDQNWSYIFNKPLLVMQFNDLCLSEVNRWENEFSQSERDLILQNEHNLKTIQTMMEYMLPMILVDIRIMSGSDEDELQLLFILLHKIKWLAKQITRKCFVIEDNVLNLDEKQLVKTIHAYDDLIMKKKLYYKGE